MGFLARLQIQVFDILDGLLWCIKELLSTTNRPKDLGRIMRDHRGGYIGNHREGRMARFCFKGFNFKNGSLKSRQ